MDKPCEICGAMLYGVHKNKKMCGSHVKERQLEHMKKQQAARRVEQMQTRAKRPCANPDCGKVFLPNRSHAIYCHPKCGSKVHRKNRVARELGMLEKELEKTTPMKPVKKIEPVIKERYTVVDINARFHKYTRLVKESRCGN